MSAFPSSHPEVTPDPAVLADLILTIARELLVLQGRLPETVELTATEVTVMRVIDRQPGITSKEVATATSLQRSNLSRALRALEQKGFVQRAGDNPDRRSFGLHPTPLAQANLARVHALWRDVFDEALKGQFSGMTEAITLLTRFEAGLPRT